MNQEILVKLCGKIQSDGVRLYISKKSSFESWLQLELCGILYESCSSVYPEKIIPCTGGKGVDIAFSDRQGNKACEIKIIYADPKCKTIQGLKRVKADIDKLSLKEISADGYIEKWLLLLIISKDPKVIKVNGETSIEFLTKDQREVFTLIKERLAGDLLVKVLKINMPNKNGSEETVGVFFCGKLKNYD